MEEKFREEFFSSGRKDLFRSIGSDMIFESDLCNLEFSLNDKYIDKSFIMEKNENEPRNTGK